MKLPRWIRLPTVVELGKSKVNALPIEGICNPSEYTWEQYYKEMKNKYPVKYFIYKTLPKFIRIKILKPFSNFGYYLKCHLLKKYRYHLLDIRQPKNTYADDQYRYGWIDSDHQMLLALFNILVNFCEKEEDVPRKIKFLKEESSGINNCFNWDEHIKAYTEIQDIYEYWKYERRAKQIELAKIFKIDKYKYFELEKEFDKIEDEMLHRLINVRKYMWT